MQHSFRTNYEKLSLGRKVAVWALVAYLAMFAFLRALVYVIHYQLLPINYVITKSGIHIHHLFWGILLLMISGFFALTTDEPKWHLRIAIIYGFALALTLDEFEMWLRLADVYFDPVANRENLTAVGLAAGFLSLYAAGAPFWHAILRDFFGKGKPRSSHSSQGPA